MNKDDLNIDDILDVNKFKKELSELIDSTEEDITRQEVMAEESDYIYLGPERGKYLLPCVFETQEKSITEICRKNLKTSYVITPELMMDLLYPIMSQELNDLDESLFQRYLDDIKSTIEQRESEWLELSNIKIKHEKSVHSSQVQEEYDIPINRYISFVLSLRKSEERKNICMFYKVRGLTSEKGLELTKIIILDTIQYIFNSIGYRPTVPSSGMSGFFEYHNRYSLGHSELVSREALPEYRDFIKYYFKIKLSAQEYSKDSLDKRISTAIRLLEISYNEKRDSLRLILSLSAIEALLCKSEAGIIDVLSRNLSTLLDPNSDNRLKHIRNIRKLYEMRSKYLHGEHGDKTNIDDKKANLTYFLGFDCLRAVIHWKTCSKRIDPDVGTQRNDFLTSLEEAVVSGKEMVGIFHNSDYWLRELDGLLKDS